jgi:hypothetical protein
MLGIKSLIGSVSRASYSIVNTCVNNISKHMNIQVRCMANHKHKKIIKEVSILIILLLNIIMIKYLG